MTNNIVFIMSDPAFELLMIALIFAFIIFLGFLLFLVIDRKARQYAKLTSEELLEKAVSSNNITSAGARLILDSIFIVVNFIVAVIASVIGHDVFHIVPELIKVTILDVFWAGLTYSLFIAIVGLFILGFGWLKGGAVCIALNTYCKRHLKPWEKKYLQDRHEIEEAARAIRSNQLIGDLAGDNVVGSSFKTKGSVDAVFILKDMALRTQKQTISISLLGLFVVEVVTVFLKQIS